MVLTEKFSEWCTHSAGKLSVKTPILVGLVIKWQTESVTGKTRLAVENQLF